MSLRILLFYNSYNCLYENSFYKVLKNLIIIGPFNLSGNWTGVMGDVVTGRYALSVSSWIHLLEREPILDFVPVLTDNDILVISPKPPLFDLHLYIRPFRCIHTYSYRHYSFNH